jgi:hypothetical protein
VYCRCRTKRAPLLTALLTAGCLRGKRWANWVWLMLLRRSRKSSASNNMMHPISGPLFPQQANCHSVNRALPCHPLKHMLAAHVADHELGCCLRLSTPSSALAISCMLLSEILATRLTKRSCATETLSKSFSALGSSRTSPHPGWVGKPLQAGKRF